MIDAEEARRSPVAVVGVVGRSGTGKTTLLERLLPALSARGLRVAAVKHTSHGFSADREGKDSHRLYVSGALAVALVSREQLATFVRRNDEGPRLAAALASLPHGLDLVLAEGFSWESIPRFVLVPEGEEPLPEHLKHGPVLERIAVPPPVAGRRPHHPPALIERLVDALVQHAAAGSVAP